MARPKKKKTHYTFNCWNCKADTDVTRLKYREMSINGIEHATFRCPNCGESQRRPILTEEKH